MCGRRFGEWLQAGFARHARTESSSALVAGRRALPRGASGVAASRGSGTAGWLGRGRAQRAELIGHLAGGSSPGRPEAGKGEKENRGPGAKVQKF